MRSGGRTMGIYNSTEPHLNKIASREAFTL
jgi:hypothetical protein